MILERRSRRRGVILTQQGLQKLQNAKSESESNDNFDKRYTRETLGFRTGLDPDTIAKVFACEVGVDKKTLKYCFQTFNLQLETNDYQFVKPDLDSLTDNREIQTAKLTVENFVDWGEAPDASLFYGRTEELATLEQWIVKDSPSGDSCASRTRLVTLLGMAGMGKTYLSVKLAQQIQDNFEFVIWRSLLPTSPVNDLLADLIAVLSNGKETELPESCDRQISRLIHYLQHHRCLLILDGAEKILQDCAPKMTCRDGICLVHPNQGGYCELFRRVGETTHQSCLILTSRVKSQQIAPLEGDTRPVRVFRLQGLQVTDIQKLFQTKGTFRGTKDDWNRLIELYAGNPLVLNHIATTIQQLFNGSITEFLDQKVTVFGSVLSSLDQEFAQLSDTAKATIQCMVHHRQPISFSKLRTQIQTCVSSQALLETLEFLQARSWIEAKAGVFSLQPMMIEYVKSFLVEEKRSNFLAIAFLDQQHQRQVAS
ncbi:NACHT domain-containing protein [Phormidium sp. LEGE 05292]|uniref:NB-ARC domain-containing protein n=1 Tax=[Phormidium] sp. LEGE 05292 TaxID=767427 RepID=UPI00188025D2|nr:NB-ARC domain-containing protein [Phormidium sp. LEGE 05292]MBE9227141.1 NACHT domain-containing protein [Phormidium sp. LEGE 05292]